MATEERGDFRYLIFVEQPPGWVPAWPQPDFESEPGAVLAARELRQRGEHVIVEKYDQNGAFAGEVLI